MAKVTVALKAGEGITDVSTALVTLHSQINLADGGFEIIPYQNATALFPPQQQVAGSCPVAVNGVVYWRRWAIGTWTIFLKEWVR